jgi:hypothetical protein
LCQCNLTRSPGIASVTPVAEGAVGEEDHPGEGSELGGREGDPVAGGGEDREEEGKSGEGLVGGGEEGAPGADGGEGEPGEAAEVADPGASALTGASDAPEVDVAEEQVSLVFEGGSEVKDGAFVPEEGAADPRKEEGEGEPEGEGGEEEGRGLGGEEGEEGEEGGEGAGPPEATDEGGLLDLAGGGEEAKDVIPPLTRMSCQETAEGLVTKFVAEAT